MVSWLILCFLLIGASYSQTGPELCEKKLFAPFSFPEGRSVTYSATRGMSDRFIREGWYGKPNFIIPSEPPENQHCNTTYPIYLLAPPPNSGQIEDVVACAVSSGRDSCFFTIPIKAVVCSASLTIYRLARTPITTSSYCLAPSIQGEFPDFATSPSITYTLRTTTNADPKFQKSKEYVFKCQFDDPNDQTLEYKSEWFVDDVSVFDSALTAYDDTDELRSLTDTKLRAAGIMTVGFQLHCEIRASFTDGNGSPSLPSRSPNLFIGIKVLNPVISIKEGDSVAIKFQPSIEIGCVHEPGCTLSVTADIPKNDEASCQPTATGTGGCGTLITTSKWKDTFVLEIAATATDEYGQSVVKRKVFLRTDSFYPSHPIWQNYFLQPITINIAKDTSLIEGRSCTIHNDPYLQSFLTTVNLSFQKEGIFTLFKTDQVEIQIEINKCDDLVTGTCVCGVVVRVGRTAFMIKRCHIGFWFIDYVLCDDGADVLTVRKLSEVEFEMFLPSGSKIIIRQNERDEYYWLSISIHPSVRDIDKTSGLCGSITNKPVEEEDADQLAERWMIMQRDSMFIPENWISLTSWQSLNLQFQHCKCHEKYVDKIDSELECDAVSGTDSCSEDTAYIVFHKKRCISPLRKKRSLPVQTSRRHIYKRDTSGKKKWTLNEAVVYCNSIFSNSMAIDRCKGIRGLNITSAIETCISDIQLSGSDAFALAAISSVSSQCLREAKMNRTLREEKVKEDKTILELVKEVACPGECSGRGRVKGKCLCNEGYIGDDCSLPLNRPPLAHNLEADGHCDLQLDDCTETAVFGGRFVDHNHTKCKLQPLTITNEEMKSHQEEVVTQAVFESIGEVTCKLPQVTSRKKRSVDIPSIDETVTGYRVSVSNNGKDYSEQLTLLVYNSLCTNCTVDDDGTIQCLFLHNYCLMDKKCYINGSIYNANNVEFVCKADEKGKSWNLIFRPENDGGQTGSNIFRRLTALAIRLQHTMNLFG